MSLEDTTAQVNDAVAGYLDDGEIAVCWILTMEVVGPDRRRYLAHRAGGGHDGSETPTVWAALGMAESFTDDARRQLRTFSADGDDEEPDAD